MKALAIVIVSTVLAMSQGCASSPAERPPPEPPPRNQVEVTVDPMVVSWRAPAPPGAADMGPSEPGFTFCCGDGRLKIEIDCSDMLKRCYERSGAGWKPTYGRHCKRALGEACYLQECDARCQ